MPARSPIVFAAISCRGATWHLLRFEIGAGEKFAEVFHFVQPLLVMRHARFRSFFFLAAAIARSIKG